MINIDYIFEPCHLLLNRVHSALTCATSAADFLAVLVMRDELNLRLTQIINEARLHDNEPHRIKAYIDKTLQILDDYSLCIWTAAYSPQRSKMVDFCLNEYSIYTQMS